MSEVFQIKAWLDQQPKEPMPLNKYLALWANWDEYKIKFLQLFQNYDVLLCPVSPQCALPHGETLQQNVVWSLIRYTASITLTECPVVVVPCGFNQQQLPIGAVERRIGISHGETNNKYTGVADHYSALTPTQA